MNQDLILQLDQIEKYYSQQFSEIDKANLMDISESESNLDGYDYLFSLVIGISGAFITTNEQVEKWLDEIHDVASNQSGNYDFVQKLIGRLVEHSGDNIDKITGYSNFMNRDKVTAYSYFHRLLWGHDIFALSVDNPFYLMFKQYGILGIVKALRHLIGDTMSKQGLPIPGSSLLDYQSVKNGEFKRSNYLIAISENLSKEGFGSKQFPFSGKVYSHMFTIRAQDIAGGGAVKLLSNLYLQRFRECQNEIRSQQFMVVSYSVCFFSQAIIGAIRQNGVPYVNTSLALTTIASIIKLNSLSKKETERLQEKTDSLCAISDELSKQAYELHLDILSDLSETLTGKVNDARNELIDFFEEDN